MDASSDAPIRWASACLPHQRSVCIICVSSCRLFSLCQSLEATYVRQTLLKKGSLLKQSLDLSPEHQLVQARGVAGADDQGECG